MTAMMYQGCWEAPLTCPHCGKEFVQALTEEAQDTDAEGTIYCPYATCQGLIKIKVAVEATVGTV